MIRFALLMTLLLLAGCVAAPRIDLAQEMDQASGLQGAVVIREESAAVESAGGVGDILGREVAVRMAIANDPRIQAAIANVRVAQAEAQQARLLPNPILNVDVRFPEGGGSQIFEASLTGDLISVLSMPGRIKAADRRMRAAAADAVSVVLDVMTDVLQHYASVQALDAEIEIMQRRDSILQQLRDMADTRLTAGEATRLDVLTLNAQRVQLELEVSDVRLERAEQRLALARLIGRARDVAEWPLESWPGPAAISAAESTWIDSALANRPEIQSLEWELSALGEDAKRAALSPLEGGEVGAHGEHDQSWIVGPTVSTPVPLFDFGQAARAGAAAQRIAAHHERDQRQLEVIEEVRSAYAACIVSRASLDAARERLLPLLEQQRAQAETEYRSGETDLTTLLLAENDLQEASLKIIGIEQRLSEAVIRLERAAGGAGTVSQLETVSATTFPSTEPTSIPGSMP